MSDFTVTDEIIAKIAVQYNRPKEWVGEARRFYEHCIINMKQQYLAHLIRTMEEQLRKISGNPMFRIVCSPVEETAKELGIARAQYFKNRYFAIYYHPKTDEKQLRMLLAHELGHLFLVEMANSTFNEQYTEKTEVEPAATIFGILAIIDKNDFYHNKTPTFMHHSVEEILNDFMLLHHRNTGILNIS